MSLLKNIPSGDSRPLDNRRGLDPLSAAQNIWTMESHPQKKGFSAKEGPLPSPAELRNRNWALDSLSHALHGGGCIMLHPLHGRQGLAETCVASACPFVFLGHGRAGSPAACCYSGIQPLGWLGLWSSEQALKACEGSSAWEWLPNVARRRS